MLFDIVRGQIAEMESVQQRVTQLEHTHHAMKQRYDLAVFHEAAHRLIKHFRYEEEIARLRHELEQRGGPSQGPHSGPSQPPPPAIGHGPANLFQGIMAGGQHGQGLAPPPQEQQGQPGLPGNMQAQGPPGLNQPPGPPPNPFAYPQAPGPGINGIFS